MVDAKGSKLMRGNWVEASATSHLDEDIPLGHTTSKRVSKEGHMALITAETGAGEVVSSNQGT